jgi:hypothetical protein
MTPRTLPSRSRKGVFDVMVVMRRPWLSSLNSEKWATPDVMTRASSSRKKAACSAGNTSFSCRPTTSATFRSWRPANAELTSRKRPSRSLTKIPSDVPSMMAWSTFRSSPSLSS